MRGGLSMSSILRELQQQRSSRLYSVQLQASRRVAHELFDRLWKLVPANRRRSARIDAYRWLAKQLGMHRKECHFSQFDIGVCDAVAALCQMVEIGMLPGPRQNNGVRNTTRSIKKCFRKEVRRSGGLKSLRRRGTPGGDRSGGQPGSPS